MGFQAGDLDGDGAFEVLFGTGSPESGQQNRLGSVVLDGAELQWLDRSAAIDSPSEEDGEAPPYNPYPYRSHGIAFADLDGDRDIDLWVGNGGMGFGPEQPEPDRLFLNETERVPAWLKIRLRGVGANTWGIGSKIRIADAPAGEETWQVYRWVYPQSGFNSHQPSAPLVGLADHHEPLHITVWWPDGHTQTLDGVLPNQALEIQRD